MRIVVVGAGALGGLVGAQLTSAGHEVVFIEINEARARMLNESGLYLSEGTKGEVCIPVRVVADVTGLPVADLVFVSVKSYQTETALRAVLPVIGRAHEVLSMQNGIGNTEMMATIIDAAAGAQRHHLPQHPAHRSQPAALPPGHQTDPDRALRRQADPDDRGDRRGVPERRPEDTNIAEQIDDVIWQKLLHNAVVNPVSALTGLTCRELLDDPTCSRSCTTSAWRSSR